MTNYVPGRMTRVVPGLIGLVLLASCGAEAPTFEPGNIIVTSHPSGAVIFLDNLDSGQVTPSTLTDLAPNDYVISVALPEFVSEPDARTVHLKPAQTDSVDFSLSQTGFRIESPPGARILVDGIDTGKFVPAAVAGLEPGSVQVSLEWPTYLITPDMYEVTIVDKEITDVPANAFSARSLKTVMMEGFSNTSCPPCPELTANLVAMAAKPAFTSDRVLYLEFSVYWPQYTDPLYQANPVENDYRIAVYNVPGAPDLYIDGVKQSDPLDSDAMENAVLTGLEADPGFLVDVTADFSTSSVPVNVTLTALRDVDLTDHVLYVAIYEKEVVIDPAPGTNGQTVFHHVFREVYRDPPPEETLPELGAVTVEIPVQFNFLLSRGDSPPDNFVALAFVQHEVSHAILQAGSSETPAVKSERDH